ncbi:hypothetical protein B0J14DRAFT_637232 [Halenospora varia]|nr:hypothetical protein B0J14DRAFT_637232 [Halenospora varia]
MSFTHFPMLPKELRLKIWKYTLSQPQVIELWWTEQFIYAPGLGIHIAGQPPPPPPRKPSSYPKAPSYPAPSILHTCHESREVGLKAYQPSIDFDAEVKKGDDERRNGEFSKYVSRVDMTYPVARNGREQIISGIDFHAITHPFCNIEIDAILIRSLIWGNGFLTVGSSYLSSVTSEPVLGKLKYLIIVHNPPREDWVRSEDSPNHVTRMTHSGRDLRALRGLMELRVLVVVVPRGGGIWGL